MNNIVQLVTRLRHIQARLVKECRAFDRHNKMRDAAQQAIQLIHQNSHMRDLEEGLLDSSAAAGGES